MNEKYAVGKVPQPKDQQTVEIVSILRIIRYVGPRKWIDEVLEGCVQGTKVLPNGAKIIGATLGDVTQLFPPEEDE